MLAHRPATLCALTLHQLIATPPVEQSALDTCRHDAGCFAEFVHADQSLVLARMGTSALLRQNDPISLLVFDDGIEEIWTNARLALRSPPSTP